MGFWDYISSTSDSVKWNSPDLTAVKGWCSSSYGHSWTAVAKIDNAVRMKLYQSMPDEEARSKMSQFATNFAKIATVHACHEGLKIIPGGTSVYNIVSRSLQDGKKVESNEGEIKALQAKIGKMEEDIMECKKVIECQRAEIIHKPFADFKSQDTSYFESNVDRKPEDVIRVFIMKESIGRQFLDGLIVPSVKLTRKDPK